MKKNFLKSIFALMCACVMTTSFVACGSDDDNNDGNKPEQPQEEVEPGKLLSASADFVVASTGLDAIKAMADDGKVMIRYTYGNGAVKTEEITSSTFQKAVDYSFNDNGDIVASVQVYLNDINEEKTREILGTMFMEVSMQGAVVLKYENTTQNYAMRHATTFKVFERTEENLNTAIKSLKRDKEKYGVVRLATYGLKANSSNVGTSSSWLGN